MAVWETPKTDWTSTDYVNPEDYNRWIGNIEFLKELADVMYTSFSIVDMGERKTYEDLIYADEINAIESNLTEICKNTYAFDIGTEQTYYANQKTLDYEEMNRIESACLTMYENFIGQYNGLKRLEFRLGGDKIRT